MPLFTTLGIFFGYQKFVLYLHDKTCNTVDE